MPILKTLCRHIKSVLVTCITPLVSAPYSAGLPSTGISTSHAESRNQPIRITMVLHPENGEHVAKNQNNQGQANNGDDCQRRGQDEDVHTNIFKRKMLLS